MPSHLGDSTRYCRKTLQMSDAAWTRVSFIPSRSLEYTSGLNNVLTHGNRILPKMAVQFS